VIGTILLFKRSAANASQSSLKEMRRSRTALHSDQGPQKNKNKISLSKKIKNKEQKKNKQKTTTSSLHKTTKALCQRMVGIQALKVRRMLIGMRTHYTCNQ
jgi:hypothetical protein